MKRTLLAAAGLAALAAPAFAEEPAPAPVSSHAPQESLWELRLGGTGLHAPDYPGADEESFNWAIAPIFIYRGDRIRFGEYGMARAIATETKRFELDLSLDAAYKAEDSDARAGMPGLDYLLQIGPQAIVNFKDTGWTADGRTEVKLRVPVRGVAATDFKSIEHAGWLAEPTLSYRHRWPGESRMGYTVSAFATFADEQLSDYYYGVAPQYAIAGRPAYQADGGYLGAGVNVSATREITPGFQLYLTWQGRTFEGAANQGSPLHRADYTSAVSISFVWKALRSKRPARNDDM